MKLVFTKSNLNKAVGIVMKAVPTRTTMNILECILIDATTNEIKFTGNDMELGIETIVEGEIIEKGKIAIDAKLFSEIVRKLPDNDITLTTDSNNNALITCEKSKFNIAGKSGDDFSYLPAIIKDKMITLSQFQLKEVINQTIFSIAINDNNKMMTGELFEVNEGTLKVVGLDGHRIAIRNIKLEGRSDDVRVVIPGKTLQEISKILNADAESFVNIYFTNNHVLFEFDQTHVVSRLIEGDYFKISQMLSNDYETKVSINKKEFLDSIDRANLLIREGDKKPIIINILNGLLQVNVNSAIGALNEDIDIELYSGDHILAQAKAIVNSSTDFAHVRTNLKKALESLSEGSRKVQTKKLILITNSPNPLNEDASRSLFWGPAHRGFSTLPESSQRIITDYLSQIDQPLDTDQFVIQVVPFETDDDSEKYKAVMQSINDFIGELKLDIPGIGKQLHRVWCGEVFKNGSKKNVNITLSKKSLIWPIIVIATDIDRIDRDFVERFDSVQYDEVVRRFRETIDSCCERVEFFTKILFDFNAYKDSGKPSEKTIDFVEECWSNYSSEFEVDGIDSATAEALSKVVVYNVIRRRYDIDKIKKGVSL